MVCRAIMPKCGAEPIPPAQQRVRRSSTLPNQQPGFRGGSLAAIAIGRPFVHQATPSSGSCDTSLNKAVVDVTSAAVLSVGDYSCEPRRAYLSAGLPSGWPPAMSLAGYGNLDSGQLRQQLCVSVLGCPQTVPHGNQHDDAVPRPKPLYGRLKGLDSHLETLCRVPLIGGHAHHNKKP
ncbi:uncharacterized protein B0I36DRAFT_353722 [Microdochium trichocladiopsis]|uniref:Uncharacterized protein n=1 Tax=Microdochium trichocladiopsis TaxID=1682393 RepID=A0A9P8XXV0_9PEZI|nr:uncharacterized protein B0I36DRAFT_353722 [Microdochium trichocladiopsis]KAH7021000.1 hypothetical protein B0I36DRAFT_353722 [Microdochium trichocladiopsis]